MGKRRLKKGVFFFMWKKKGKWLFRGLKKGVFFFIWKKKENGCFRANLTAVILGTNCMIEIVLPSILEAHKSLCRRKKSVFAASKLVPTKARLLKHYHCHEGHLSWQNGLWVDRCF